MGRFLVWLGIFLIISGMFLHYKVHLPCLSWIGKLPGDILVRKDSLTIYFPLASSFLISVLLSIVFSIFRK